MKALLRRTTQASLLTATVLTTASAPATVVEISFFQTTDATIGADYAALANQFIADGGSTANLSLIDTISFPELQAGAVVGTLITVDRNDGNRNPLNLNGVRATFEGLFTLYDFDSPTGFLVDITPDPITYANGFVAAFTNGPDGTLWTPDDIRLLDEPADTEFDGFIYGGLVIDVDTFAETEAPAGTEVTEIFSARAEVVGGIFNSSVFGDGESTLTVTTIPEPAAATLLLGGGVGLLARRRRS